MRDFLDPEQVWEECTALFWEYLQKEPSLEDEIDMLCSDIPIGKEEYALGAKYLHRGPYCPSPVHDKLVIGIRRGRIAKRMTKASRPTNRYEFDLEGKLRLAETIYPNGHVSTEFLFYEENVVFGLTYGGGDKLTALSVERYSEGRLGSYVLVDCYRSGSEVDYVISKVAYERYHYDGDTMTVDAIYDLSKHEEMLSGWCTKVLLRGAEGQGWELISQENKRFAPGMDVFLRYAAEKGYDTELMEEVIRKVRSGG